MVDLLAKRVHKAGMTERGARSLQLLCGIAALVLAGCATVQDSVGGWFGSETPTPAPAAAERRVYYAGIDDLKVHGEPSASSKVVGTLALHEKVIRTKVEKGFAYVESSTSTVTGWVTNAQLIWRLPSTPTNGTPARTKAQPAEPVEAEEVEEPAAPPTAPPEPQAVEPTAPTLAPRRATPVPKMTPNGAAPSIFNPY